MKHLRTKVLIEMSRQAIKGAQDIKYKARELKKHRDEMSTAGKLGLHKQIDDAIITIKNATEVLDTELHGPSDYEGEKNPLYGRGDI